MILRERVSNHAYIFRSELYAQVNAGLVVTDEGCVLIDTLPFPQETNQMKRFIEERLHSEVRYIVLTHSHADHVYGAYLFPEAEVVGHLLSRELMIKQTRPALTEARKKSAALAEVYLRLPTILTEKEASIRIGGFTLILRHSPGHAPDVISVYFRDEKILFASDTIMPIPFFANGDINDLRRSLRLVQETTPLEDIVQGHGEVLLRGEVNTIIQEQLAYLDKVEEHVEEVIAKGGGKTALDALSLETAGISPTALNGLVQKLHLANIYTLYAQRRKQRQRVAA